MTVGAVSSHGVSVYFCQASVSQRRSSSDYCRAWPKVATFNEKFIHAQSRKDQRCICPKLEWMINNKLFILFFAFTFPVSGKNERCSTILQERRFVPSSHQNSSCKKFVFLF